MPTPRDYATQIEGMIVHFGLHLDGMQPGPPSTAAGEVTLGSVRFLDLLELRLGLPPTFARPGEALLAYQSCLSELDDPGRFYHRSFAVDAIGVARTLLDWRAQWYEAGWTGAFTGQVSQRLADMAEVERLASARTLLTPGQRLQRVATALEARLTTQIDRVVLHSAPSELSATWRKVLEHFEVTVTPGVNASVNARATTDLHRVQSALLDLAASDEGTQHKRRRLARDDTLIMVRAISRDSSAQVIGEYLLKKAAPYETAVIAEHDGIILDNALERVGLPRAGFQHYSRFRAVAQVLKLCLGLVWEPISAHLLLQFLIHPVGPLPDHARSRLAEAVAREPGIGGRAWTEAIETVKDRLATKFGRSETQIAEAIEEITYWLQCPRYKPADGAPLSALMERAQRCTTWLARRLHATEKEGQIELYAAAQAQGEALIGALADLQTRGDSLIQRIALERLVDEVSAQAADPATFAQAGHVRATTQPGAITQPWGTVIWWDLAPRTPTLTYPWAETELEELAREGVALPPVAERIRHRVGTWLRPILNARSQLILVVHERDEGHHPLWSRLRSLFENFNEVRIDDALLGDPARSAIPVLEIPTHPLAVRPLQKPRRWWRLPTGCSIPARPTESYSSLKQLFDSPHEWVLSYAARLHHSRMADLPSPNLLYGNLAHRLFQTFFTTHDHWAQLDDRSARAWLAGYLPTLIAQEGALLCEPGAAVAREQVTTTLEDSFIRLLAHLRSAEIEAVSAEQPNEAPFKDVTLRGAIDLVLCDRQGREIVLDVKWGSQEYRGAELTENRYLQLATYAYLRRKAGVGWPHHAYYIVSTGNVLAQDAKVFPEAIVYRPAAPGNIESIWTRVGAMYDWRRAQISANEIELNVGGTEPTAASTPPPNALTAAGGPSPFDEYTWLTGWEEGV